MSNSTDEVTVNHNLLKIGNRVLKIGSRVLTPLPTTYEVTVVQVTGGTITATPASGFYGTVITLSQTPDSSHNFDNFTVNGETIVGNTFVLEDNVTVSGSYTEKPYVPDIYATTGNAHVVSQISYGTHEASILPSLAGYRRYDVLKMNLRAQKQNSRGQMFMEFGTDYRSQGEFPYNLNNANRFIMPFIITSYGSGRGYIGPYCVCRGCGSFTGEPGISSGTVNFGTGVGSKTVYYDPSLSCQNDHSLKLIFDTQTGNMRVYWDGVYKGQGTVSNPNKLRFGVAYTADFGDLYVTNIERALIETDHDATRW